jgi:hypothetical protein
MITIGLGGGGASARRGFLRGGFTLVGNFSGLPGMAGQVPGNLTSNNQCMSPFDWDLSSAAVPHVPGASGEAAKNGTQITGGKTL